MFRSLTGIRSRKGAAAHGSEMENSEEGAPQLSTGLQIVHTPLSTVVDIVFIHGITGHPYRTWTASNEEQPWIMTLLPKAVPGARILTFGYQSKVVGLAGEVSHTTLRHHAMSLMNEVCAWEPDRQQNPSRPIIFVCHSLGGLLLQKAFSLARQEFDEAGRALLRCTYGVVFMGTPLRGAENVGRMVDILQGALGIVGETNKDLVDVLKSRSKELRDLQASFEKLRSIPRPDGLQGIRIMSFFETRSLPPFGIIVREENATLDCGRIQGIEADHKTMVQFASPNDSGFRPLTAELNLWIIPLRAASTPATVSMTAGDVYRDGHWKFVEFMQSQKLAPAFRQRSAELLTAIGLLKQAVQMAESTQPRDSSTWIKAHIDIAQCYRELSNRHRFNVAQKQEHMAEAVKNIHQAHEEATRIGQAPLLLRARLERAVIIARRVIVDEMQPDVDAQGALEVRRDALEELNLVIRDSSAAGKPDFVAWGKRWVGLIGSSHP